LCPIGSEDKEQLMAIRDRLMLEEVLAAFDEHLRRTRGVCAGTRRNYVRFAGAHGSVSGLPIDPEPENHTTVA
jgi:hypothetical protein